MRFTKMQCCGNDFVILYNPHRKYLSKYFIRKIAHRQTGIGFNQLLCIYPPRPSQKEDHFIRIFNSDSSEAFFCGNGILCLSKLYSEKNNNKEQCLLSTLQYTALAHTKDQKSSISVHYPQWKTRSGLLLSQCSTPWLIDTPWGKIDIFVLSYGTDHALLIDPQYSFSINAIGSFLNKEYKLFPEGVIVHCIYSSRDANTILLHSYERGAGETLSCGSGACASFMVWREIIGRPNNNQCLTIRAPGGTLRVQQGGESSNQLLLIGSPHIVFKGYL